MLLLSSMFPVNSDYNDYKKAISQKQTFFLPFSIFRLINRILGKLAHLWYINNCTVPEHNFK